MESNTCKYEYRNTREGKWTGSLAGTAAEATASPPVRESDGSGAKNTFTEHFEKSDPPREEPEKKFAGGNVMICGRSVSEGTFPEFKKKVRT